MRQAERAALWDAYRADRSIDNRNRLVEVYWPCAQIAARKLWAGHRQLDCSELETVAAEAVICAVEACTETEPKLIQRWIMIVILRRLLDGIATQYRRRRADPISDTDLVERLPTDRIYHGWRQDQVMDDNDLIANWRKAFRDSK